jgi:hypothetical protein
VSVIGASVKAPGGAALTSSMKVLLIKCVFRYRGFRSFAERAVGKERPQAAKRLVICATAHSRPACLLASFRETDVRE